GALLLEDDDLPLAFAQGSGRVPLLPVVLQSEAVVEAPTYPQGSALARRLRQCADHRGQVVGAREAIADEEDVEGPRLARVGTGWVIEGSGPVVQPEEDPGGHREEADREPDDEPFHGMEPRSILRTGDSSEG